MGADLNRGIRYGLVVLVDDGHVDRKGLDILRTRCEHAPAEDDERCEQPLSLGEYKYLTHAV